MNQSTKCKHFLNFSRAQYFLFFVWKKKKNYNAVVSRQNIRIRLLFFLLFDVNFLFCFVLFLQDKFWCFYHFLWAFWLKRKCTFHAYIYTNKKLNPFSNKICNFYLKNKKKKSNCQKYIYIFLIYSSIPSVVRLLFFFEKRRLYLESLYLPKYPFT